MAGLADQVEVARLPVGMLEAETAFAEVDLAGDAGVHHPLQRAVDGGAADALIFAPDEVDEVVGAEVPFLAQEHVDDLFPLAGALAARRLEPGEVLEGGRPRRAQTLNDDPHPQVEIAFGFLMVKPPPVTVSTKSTSAPLR